jgi:hypothetical protein
MATLPALVSALAEMDDREFATVQHVGRTLREMGLIPTGKRGAGATAMGVTAAANLLIALNAGDAPKEAAATVPQFRSLKKYPGVSKSFEFPDVWGEIEAAKTFGEALEVLITNALGVALSFHQFAEHNYSDAPNPAALALGPLALITLEVELTRFPARARVRVVHYGRENMFDWRFEPDFQDQPRDFYRQPPEHCDRTTSCTFGLNTLLKLGAALDDAE